MTIKGPSTDGTSPWVSIVLLNYNGYADTIECLESLLTLDYRFFNIIVVDNHSPDNSLTFIHEWLVTTKAIAPLLQPPIHKEHEFIATTSKEDWSSPLTNKALVSTIQAGQNLGFAAGNNIGITYALSQFSPDFVWLLNNDTVVAPDSLTQLISHARQELSAGLRKGIWGSKLLYYHQPDTIQAIGGKLNLTTLTTSHIAEGEKDSPAWDTVNGQKIDYIIGASMLVSKSFLEEVGLLNEAYFLYFEELDWATRGKAKGYGLSYVSKSRVFHKEGKSAGSSSSGGKKSDLADLHGLRSKIIFFTTHYPQRKFQLYFSFLTSAFLRLVRGDLGKAQQALKLLFNLRKV